MDGLLQETERAPGIGEVRAICALLEDHKGGDVIALDLRELHSWTDFFVIATVTSNAHLEGLLRHINDYAGQEGLAIYGGRRKSGSSGGWELIDMGMAVIHLMSAQTREFYELEELWLSAGKIYP
ncbi:MAG: ribosome silencing factor [Spirochaetaceae bacterium]|jgi:ribosome-associated protein|nr:ribosome silencing factor [Spirochaetaceae bacterium]